MTTLEIQPLRAGHTEIPHDAAVRLLRGNEHFAAGDLKAAALEYEAALELHPGFTEALNNLGAALGQLGQSQAALDCFLRSLEIAPDDAVTLANVALVYVLLDEADNALDYFGRSLEIEPSYTTLNNRATLLGRLGRLDEALRDVSFALAMAPDDEIASFNRSGILLAMGRHREALQDIEALERRLPDNDDVAQRRRQIVDASLRQLAESGVVLWSGQRAQGSRDPVPVTPGPPVSDYVIEDRR
jgi:tetratricopeptide (TPR) repeat protein